MGELACLRCIPLGVSGKPRGAIAGKPGSHIEPALTFFGSSQAHRQIVENKSTHLPKRDI